MSRTDTTPFRDPRNAVGLLTDVLDLALAGLSLASPTLHPVVQARDLGRAFTKAPRRVFNGYRRKGFSDLYQRVKTVREEMPHDLWAYDNKKREFHGSLRSISERGLIIIEKVMEDFTLWNKPVSKHRDPEIAEWHRDWHDHVSGALRLGACQARIAEAECGWRFRDLTDRSHRGRNIKAAFEAAWLAGQYKFAKQLITQEFK